MKRSIYLTLVLSLAAFAAMAQTYTVSNKTSKLEVFGTSTLHDWEIKAETVSGKADLTVDGANVTINSLYFQLKGETLKSGKSSMDKNTYEALKTDDHPWIKYQLKTAKAEGGKLSTTGTLTIAGASKQVQMTVTPTVEGNKVSFKGKITFKMSDFKIDPPTALMGTIKTGDEVTISFDVQYTK